MCNYIRSTISLAITIIVLVSLFSIRSDTSVNPFNKQFEPGEKEHFFYDLKSNPLILPSEIGIKCQMYQNTIMDPNVKKLSDVFNLGIEVIHDKINSLIIVAIMSFVFLIFYFICLVFSMKTQSLTLICLSFIIIIASMGFAISNLILLYKLITTYYYSDMNQFIEFLQCKNVIKEGFSKYLYVEDLHKNIATFIIYSIIQIIWNLGSNQNTSNNSQSRNNNDDAIELSENL